MGESRKEFIVCRVRSRPPLTILVKTVLLRPHDVERNHAHHTLRTNRAGIRRTVIARTDEGVHIIYRLLRRSEQTATQQEGH